MIPRCEACGRDMEEKPLFTGVFYECPQPCIGSDGITTEPPNRWAAGPCTGADCWCQQGDAFEVLP